MTVTLEQIDTTPQRRPGDFKRDAKGTPYVSDPTGAVVKSGARKGEPKWAKYSRPSGYHHQIEDGYNLTKWDQRNIVLGLADDPTLAERLAALAGGDRDDKAWRDDADALIGLAKQAAKAQAAADQGTHIHAVLETDDLGASWLRRAEAGEDLGIPAGVQGALVGAWRRLLAEYGIEILAAEMAVVNDEFRTAGTLDRIARLARPLRFVVAGEIIELPAGLVVVLDIKTGSLRLDERDGQILWWHGYAVQCALYAGSTPYDVDTETRTTWEWPVDQRWALIAHVPVAAALEGRDEARLVLVDLDRGRHAAELCRMAKAWEASRDLFGLAADAAPPATAVPPPASPPDPGEAPPAPATVTMGASTGDGSSPQGGAPGATLAARAARLRDVDGASAWLAARWPQGAPKVSQLADPAHIDAVERLVAACEAQFVVPFASEVDATRPTPTNRMPTGADTPPAPTWQRPDDGGPADPAAIEALRRSAGQLPTDLQALMQAWGAQALRAGRAIVTGDGHTVRSFEVLRAMVNAAMVMADKWGHDDELLRLHLAAALRDEAATRPGVEVGAIFAALTVAEAQAAAAAFELAYDAGSAVAFDDDGRPVLVPF